MGHLALYRKYRPKDFDGIIGQESVTKTIKNQVKEGKISHAYLFSGPRGTGKTSVAKIFAKSVNCESPKEGSACHECRTCKALESKGHIDILEIDAASNNKVEEVRDLREKIKYTPINGKYKVYIIDEVHMLTESAFNALLKTLEEPPEHAIFVLATTEVHKLPATILSRVIKFDFKLVEINLILKHLEQIFDQEGHKFEEGALMAIANAAEGSLRDALSIAEMCIGYSSGSIIDDALVASALGTTSQNFLNKFSEKMINRDIKSVLSDLEHIYNSGKNLKVFIKDLAVHFRHITMLKLADDPKDLKDIIKVQADVYKELIEQSTREDINIFLAYMKGMASLESKLRNTPNQRIIIETTLIDMLVSAENISKTVVQRLDKLEKIVLLSNKQSEEKNSEKATIKKQVSDQKEKSSKHIALDKNNKAVNRSTPSHINIDDNKAMNVIGKILINLREEGQEKIYNIISQCGNIKGVNNKIVIFVKKDDDFNYIMADNAQKVVNSTLENINKGLEIIFRSEKNIEKEIEKKFNKNLKIID